MSIPIAVDAREWARGRHTGIGRFLEEVVRRGLDVRPEIEWILYVSSDHEQRVAADNVSYRGLPPGPVPWVDQVALPRMLRRKPPALFFSPYVKVPWRTPCPSVCTVHDLLPLTLPPREGGLRGPHRRWFAWYARRCLNSASAIVTVSASSACEIERSLGTPRTPVYVIFEAPAEAFRRRGGRPELEVRSEFDLEGPYLLAVGNYSPHKNIGMLLRAWAAVIRSGTVGTLVLAGGGGGADSLKRLAGTLGIEERVRWTGRVPGELLPGLYRSARALLQPSYSEGFGLPVVEAMASGTPVVVSDRGSLPEVVGDAAPILDPDDVDGWADAMRAMLEDASYRERWAAAAAGRSGDFTPETTTDRLLDLLVDAVHHAEWSAMP